jgi:hypothetical protein
MHTSNSNRSTMKGLHLSLQPAQAWVAILGFTFITILGIVAGVGSVLRFLFPAGAVCVGLLLYFRYPLLYLGFNWWIWFLSPLVRRLIDYDSGWQDPSIVLLAPYLVTFISAITLWRYLPRSNITGGLPFVLSAAGVTYGLFVGVVNSSPTAVVVPFLDWAAPIIFGFHLFANWQNYPSLKRNTERTFLWGGIITGAYGIWQYLVAPEWDGYWLTNTGLITFGEPEPLAIRVWSTMHSPGPFAVVMMAALLLLFHHRGALLLPASGIGYLSFLLSQVRAAWLGWGIGLIASITSLKQSLQIRLIVTLVVMAVCVIPLATIEPYSEVISERLESLSGGVSNDTSYQDRMQGYNDLLSLALVEFLGRGLGFVIQHSNFGSNDSGILSLLLTLGWFGSLFYLGGLLLLLFHISQANEARFDSFVTAARAISFAVFAQIGLGTAMLELSGMVLWSFLSIGIAAHKYYGHQARLRRGT